MAQTALPGVGQVSSAGDIGSIVVISAGGAVKRAAPNLISGGGGSSASAHTDTRAPLLSDDGTAGYSAGQFWINTVTGRVWVARTVATGAAVWEPIGAGRHPGYLAGNAYLPGGLKLAANGTTIVPSTAGRILFVAGDILERVSITNFLVSVSTAVAGTLAQVAVYNIDPTTKRPIGAPLATTADIDCSTASSTVPKSAAPVSAVTLEPKTYAWGVVVNQATGSTFRAYDVADGVAQTTFGASNPQDVFGTLTGVYFAGTYGTWPNFASNATFSPSYGAVPIIGFVAGAPT